ncbi:hypothetical protein PENTCL1PPCAC_12281 [Pristionchus entomophagus]|uniref:Uncharacterized protein n=1 Tax=Pristionchus entomophagus TaxID=358040 RepID=A0AAV5T3L6_9BILA|nr:hypothetical protein PENTCL1PPCAC_12281 [Pristionchus entomophagus]
MIHIHRTDAILTWCGRGKRSTEDEKLSTQPWEPTPFGPWKRLAEEQGSYNCYARCMANPHNENCSRWCSPGKRSTEEGDCIQDCHQKEGFSWQVCLRRCHVTKRSIEEILKTGL